MIVEQTAAPDYFYGPGDSIQEWLDENSMTQTELATRLNMSTKALNQIIKVGAPLSQETALKLETVTEVPAQFWNAKEAIFQERKLKLAEQKVARENLKLLEIVPILELRKRGVITASRRDLDGIYNEVIAFFQVADFKAWVSMWGNQSLAFRKSKVFPSNVGPMATWLRLGEIEATKQAVREFDSAGLKMALTAIKSLTTEPNPKIFLPRVQKFLNDYGVRFVIVPDVPGTACSGVTRWVAGVPIIQLSLRHKTDDHLWFTLFHEIAHVLDPAKKSMDISTRDNIVIADDRIREREAEADKFASEILIPSKYERHLRELSTQNQITQFAKEHLVSPGIVLGRMQYLQLVDYSTFSNLKVRYKFKE